MTDLRPFSIALSTLADRGYPIAQISETDGLVSVRLQGKSELHAVKRDLRSA